MMKRLLAAIILACALPAFAQSVAITNKNTVTKDGGALTFSGANRLCFVGSSSGTACLTMPAVASSSASIINGALGYTPANVALVSPTTFTSSGTPGNYTLANSGIVVRNGAGDEVLRVWATDPDGENFNSNNLYLGNDAGFSQPTDNDSAGFYNTGIGFGALYSSLTSSANVAVGKNALHFNTTGGDQVGANTAVGVSALGQSITGGGNTAVGYSAMGNSASGDLNTAFGYYALNGQNTGSNNVGIGIASLSFLTTGSRNTMVGTISDPFGDGYPLIKTGNDNTIVGFNSGPSTVDTSNAIAIGSGVDVSASNRAVIGNSSTTDLYAGSESAAAAVHATDFIVGSTSIRPIRCVSGALSGALTLGSVNTATATCAGATNAMAVACSYTADPGTLVAAPKCVVSSTNTVTVTESGLGIVTPASTTVQIAVTP